MPVNDLCWCGSGKKWKKCHRDRDQQKAEPIGKLVNEMRIEMAKGYCLHPDASPSSCSSRVIQAHTVQRKGGLNAIAENGHVISPKRGFEDIFKNDGEIIPREHGIRDASTFMGFCGFHDDRMFKPIEQKPLSLNQQTAFLLSFRALAYEFFSKEAALRTVEIQRAMDKGKSFQLQCAIQEFLHIHREGLKRGMQDLRRCKEQYDNAYRGGKFDDFVFYGVRFSGMLPVVGCGAFDPEYDFQANRLQIITRAESNVDHICLNLTIIGDKSVLVLGWPGNSTGPAAAFSDSYRALPDSEKANAAMYLVCEHIENIYFRPSWWTSQPAVVTDNLVQRFRSGIGMPGTQRIPGCLSQFKHRLSGFNVEQEFRS